MKIFISWSGPRSQMMAEALRDWLPNVIQAVEPWTSSSDIDAGARWTPALAEQLQQTQLGIMCLTAENLSAPWILFESGALSKIVDKTRVCPYLLGLEPTDITGPLAQFQAVKAEENGTKKLLQSINRTLGELALPEDRLNRIFDVFWPSLEDTLSDIPSTLQETIEPRRSLEDMVEEILRIVRDKSITLYPGTIVVDQPLKPNKQMMIQTVVHEIANELTSRGIEAPVSEIEQNTKKLIGEFDVPAADAKRSLLNRYFKEAGIELRLDGNPAE